jgi:hypothetical protein
LRQELGLAVAAALTALLVRRYVRQRDARRVGRFRLFDPVLPLLGKHRFADTEMLGFPKLCAHYNGFPVQVLPVVDTLPVRRLPALWLLVTLQDPLPLRARLDLVMRPNGPTTFSNFDSLAHTLNHDIGLPGQAVIRTDDPDQAPPVSLVQPYREIFLDHRIKELLIAPNGLRLVWLLAEADRARYGVFRQADFGAAGINPDVLKMLLDQLIRIRQSVLDWSAARG